MYDVEYDKTFWLKYVDCCVLSSASFATILLRRWKVSFASIKRIRLILVEVEVEAEARNFFVHIFCLLCIKSLKCVYCVVK